jgi:hypothetical protein
MHDHTPLNDPELGRLELRLSRASWSPTPAQRERWLYACGQAAGRAQMRRRLRGAISVAVLLGCVCVGLTCALLKADRAQVAAVNPAPSPFSANLTPTQHTGPLPLDEPAEAVADSRRELRVSASLAELASSDVFAKTPASEVERTPAVAEPVLTAAGPLSGAL